MSQDLPPSADINKLVDALTGISSQLEQLFDNRTDQGSPYMDPDEAADYLKIDRKVLLELGRQGKIPRAKLGKSVRFHKEDLDAFMRNGGTSPRKPKRKNRPGATTLKAV